MMQFQLITLAGVKLDEPVYEVMIPTTEGQIAVFPSHEPLVAVAQPGAVAVRRQKTDSDDQLEYFAISGDDIVEAETQAALERALKMRDEAQDQVELEKAHQLVDRHRVRLHVAGLRRRHRRR